MTIVPLAVALWPKLSVTRTVIAALVGPVGVPPMVPVVALIDRPAGSVPAEIE